MRVLVTGTSGLVGRAIADRLAAAGHETIGLSRRLLGPGSLSSMVSADVASRRAMEEVVRMEPCEAIVHAAAAISSDPHAPPVAEVNCEGAQNVLWLAEMWRASHFLFASSVQVIGGPRRLPVTEDHPLDPPTAYHASKLFGERLTELAGARGVRAASLRLTSPAGPGMPDGRILSVFVRRALAGEPLEVAGEGSRAQDYVDVRDVAGAALACLEAGATGVFNVAAGHAVTNYDLARRCVEALGSASEVHLGDRPDPEEGVRWEVSIARAAEAFGYKPRCSLEDSIAGVAEQRERGLARAVGSPARPADSRG
jgi:nucleoside-diphosphate-sugar epimerase